MAHRAWASGRAGVAGLALGLAPAMPASAQDETPAVGGPSERVDEARALLAEIDRAYTRAPGLTDKMTMTVKIPDMGEESVSCTIRMDKRNVEIKGLVDTFDVFIVDGTLFAKMDGAGDDEAVRAELGDDPRKVLREALGEMLAPFLPPHVDMRLVEGHEGNEAALGMGFAKDLRLAGHLTVTDESGAELREILLSGSSNGEVRLRVDPESKLIRHMVVEGLPEGYPGTEPLTLNIRFEPKIVESLEAPIAFADEGVEFHDTLDELMMAGLGDMGGADSFNPTIEVGAEAPAFALVDQNGKGHSLGDYRGKLVLMDWWGVW